MASRGETERRVLTLLCSFRTVLSQTWRLWFAPATGKMGPCQCCRYVRVVVGDPGTTWSG